MVNHKFSIKIPMPIIELKGSVGHDSYSHAILLLYSCHTSNKLIISYFLNIINFLTSHFLNGCRTIHNETIKITFQAICSGFCSGLCLMYFSMSGVSISLRLKPEFNAQQAKDHRADQLYMLLKFEISSLSSANKRLAV
jgi:hypothetical protein